MAKKHKQNFAGFTLIELLVTIVIIGILSVISVSSFQGYFKKTRLAKARYAAKQVEKLFLAQNASTEENLFTGWYAFDGPNDINQTRPYVLDKSEAINNLVYAAGSGTFSQSDDTGLDAGKSLRIDQKLLYRTGSVPGGPVDKLTMSSWIKIADYPHSYTYPLFLASSAGFRLYSDGRLMFYINSAGDYVISPTNSINTEEWHHIIGSYDGSTIRLWIDGNIVGTKRNVNQTVPFQGKGLFFGYHPGGVYFNGWLDEVMVFPYAFGGENLN